MNQATSTAVATVTAVDIFNDFALNEVVEEQGAWVHYRGDVEFLIARNNNRSFKRKISHQYKKHQRLLDANTEASEEKSNAIMVEIMADTILLGWKGNLVVQGNALPYTKENARKMLSIKLFREWVTAQSQDLETYKAVKDEEDEKN